MCITNFTPSLQRVISLSLKHCNFITHTPAARRGSIFPFSNKIGNRRIHTPKPEEEEGDDEDNADDDSSCDCSTSNGNDHMNRKDRAKERREKRMHEISLIRTIPYSDHQRWWCPETIAVVTGANRGIGFEIARQLAGHGLTVILTSREIDVGEEAASVLQEGGLNVAFHQLDVVDPASIKLFSEWVQQTYGGIDILVNNAGVNFNIGTDNSVEFAEKVIGTNYYGTKNAIEAMIPLMKPSASGARIVSVSSRLGRVNGRRNRIEDAILRQQLSNDDLLSEELIDRTLSTFLQQVGEDTWKSGGWPQTFTDYSVSKLAVNTYTRLMANVLSNRPEGQKIYINCFCPGWVKTAMTGWAGNISAAEGADTGVWLALLPPDQPVTGKFFAERREISF